MFSSVVFAHAPYAFLPECWRSAGAAHMGRRPGGLYGQITHKACAKCVLTKLVKAQQKLQQLKFSSYLRWVAPFGNRRIKGYSHLPDAYRSVSRPSSPVHAKASIIACACQGIHQMPLRHLITLIANIHQTSAFYSRIMRRRMLPFDCKCSFNVISRKTSFSRYNRWRGQAANHSARFEQTIATLS